MRQSRRRLLKVTRPRPTNRCITSAACSRHCQSWRKTAGLSTAALEKLNQSVQQMFEAYGKIDDAIHQKKEADYPAVAEQLDQSMTAISSLLASPPPAEK